MGVYDVISNVASGICSCKIGGNSTWGSLAAATLPYWVGNNNGAAPWGSGNGSGSGASPWGAKTEVNTCPYTGMPNTGVTRQYDFVLSRDMLAPDGYLRSTILVNGQFPGPLIEANWGDKISINVYNNISGNDEGATVHWHGFLQTGNAWDDGVPGVSQCPIAPGTNYTYEITAEVYGTSWYHSHYSAQYSGGALGPIVIYGPQSNEYDIDIGPVMINDWYHKSYTEIIDEVLSPNNGPRGLDPLSDNNMIQGRANFDCSTVAAGDKTPCVSNAGLAKFKFVKGKTHRLRLINAGSDGVQLFSIDEHTMTVIATDFVPTVPYKTNVVTLGIGQRSDVLVTANAEGSSFWMRSNITSCTQANQPLALAVIYYDDANTTETPTSQAWDVADPGTCENDPLTDTVPVYVMPVATPDYTMTMNVGLTVNATNVTLITFNNISGVVDFSDPVLPAVTHGNLTFPPVRNVINLGENNTVRMIINNPGPAAHPMHLHGHNFQVLNFGTGSWDGTTIINQANPTRRDVQLLPGGGYLVVQFTANAGVWAWHCHIAWHASAGFISSLIVDEAATAAMYLPAKVEETCKNWAAFTSKFDVDQLDSGL